MGKRVLLVLTVLTALAPSVPGAAQSSGNGGGSPGTSLNFELVGHEPLFARGMNAALAIFGSTAYIGNRTDGSSTCGLNDPRREEVGEDACPHIHPGILVVDVREPSSPSVVGEIGPPHAGNVNETTRELRVWPQKEMLIVLSFACSSRIHACPGGSVTPRFRFFDLSDPLNPIFLSEYVPRQANGAVRTPHEFYLWVDPANSDRALMWFSTPTSSRNPSNANMMIVDISGVPDGEDPVLVAQGNWNPQFPSDVQPRLHSMTPTFDGRLTHLAYLDGHLLLVDTSRVVKEEVAAGPVEDLGDDLLTRPESRPTWENPNPAHSAVPFPGRPFSLVTDEVYGTFTNPAYGCPWGWARLINVAQPKRPRIVGEYKIAENSCPPPSEADQKFTSYASHNPTLTRKLALISWHSGGLQAVDVSDPAATTQAGWFSPTPIASVATEDPALSSGDNKVVMWSFPIIKDGLVYVVDVRNGLYVLRYNGPRSRKVAGVSFLEGNSNLGDAGRLAKSARP